MPNDIVKNEEPLISVIVPCHNVEATIANSIRSVCRQIHQNFEVICVENGSTDQTEAVLESLAQADSRIKVTTSAVASPGAARMVGIAASRGDYIAFLDGDDFFEVDFLSELLSVLTQENADIVQCAIRYSYTDRAYSHGAPAGIIEGVHCKYRLDIVDELPFLLPQLWNKLYKRHVLDAITINDAYFEDIECLPRIAARCEKVAIISDALYTYNKKFSKITGSNRVDLTLADKYFDDLLLSQTPYLDDAFAQLLYTWGTPLPACVYANLGNYLRSVEETLEDVDLTQQQSFVRKLERYTEQLRMLARPDDFASIVKRSYKLKGLSAISTDCPFFDRNVGGVDPELAQMEQGLADLDIVTPKDPNLWVFATWGHYGRHTLDNPRAVFEMVKHRPEIRKVILMNGAFSDVVHDGENVTFFPLQSQDGLVALTQAGVIVTGYSLHNIFGYRRLVDSPDRKIVQAWHGIPIKKIGLSVHYTQEPFWEAEHARYAAIPSSSAVDQQTMIRSFAPSAPERVKLTGLPRHDFLKQDEDSLPVDYQEHLEILRNRLDGRRLILFATTWRANPAERINFDLDQIMTLNALFQKYNAVLGVRLHPNMKQYGMSFPVVSEHIIQLSDLPDVNIVMRLCDSVVTDYSSLYLDFMQLSRPVILYTPDMKLYARNRGFNYAGDDFRPHADAITDFDGLLTAIEDVLSGKRGLDGHFAAVAQRFHAFPADGKAAQRLIDAAGLLPMAGRN